MSQDALKSKAKKPVMVMLHGSGSSAAILGIQSHQVAKELSKTYDLVFLDAPVPCTPGPGVLPLFADMPGYYRWLTPGNVELSKVFRLAELFEVARYIQTQLDGQGVKASDVQAMLGFSQGALVALAMLGFRLIGQSIWENLRFCVAIGAGTTGNTAQMAVIQDMVNMLSSLLGRDDGKFPGYSVQAMGLQDPWYQDGKKLSAMSDPACTRFMNYRDGHVVPRRRPEVQKLVQAIQAIDKASQGDSVTARPVVESIPSQLTGDLEQGLSVLAANGIVI